MVTPLAPRSQGRTLSLPVAPPARSLSAVAGAPGKHSSSRARAPAGWVPAGHSPPRLHVPSRPWWWAELDRVAGDSHTWFTEGTAGAGVRDAYLISVPSLGISAHTHTHTARGPRHKTEPEGQILMLKSSKPNSPSAPLPVNPKFHPNLGLRADPTHTHALLALDTAGVAALVSECPAAGVRGAPRPRMLTDLGGHAPRLRQSCASSRAAPSALRAPRSASQGASAVNSRVQPVTRAPQAPQTGCHTLSSYPAPSAGA